MRLLNRKIGNSLDIELCQLTETDAGRILEGYTLLRDAMGEHLIEDVESFRGTISTATDNTVVPRIVCALYRDEMIGISIGSYLRNLSVGFMCYGAVATEWRRQGIYTAVRNGLIDLLSQEANIDGLQFVISELEEDGAFGQAPGLFPDDGQPVLVGLVRRSADRDFPASLEILDRTGPESAALPGVEPFDRERAFGSRQVDFGRASGE